MFMGLSVEVMMGGLGLLYTELDPLHHVNCMWGEDKLHVPGILSKKRFFFIFKNQIFNGFFFIFSMFMLQFWKVNIIFFCIGSQKWAGEYCNPCRELSIFSPDPPPPYMVQITNILFRDTFTHMDQVSQSAEISRFLCRTPKKWGKDGWRAVSESI